MATMLLQWNARSVQANKADLLDILSAYNVKVAAISETWLDPHQFFHIPGYSVLRCDRFDGYGGTALLVRKDVTYTELPIQFNPIDYEVVAIEVNNITIVSIYIPPRSPLMYHSVQNLIQQLKHPFILLGDMNAHSPSWGSPFVRGHGHLIDRLLDEFDLNILNNGEDTMLRPPSGNKSIIDLVICSPTLQFDLKLSVLRDTHGSNHYPILVEHLNTHPRQKTGPNITNNLYNWKKTDWQTYTTELENNSELLDSYDNMTDKYKFFRNSIVRTIQLSTPKPRFPKNPRPPTPWWDSECKDVKENRRTKMNEYKNSPTLENFIEAKRAMALAKKVYKRKKRDGFRKFCEELSADTPISRVWNSIKRFRKASSFRSCGVHKIPCADDLLDSLCPPFATFPIYVFPEILDPFLDRYFSEAELQCVLNLNKTSSAGPDPIHYAHLKNLPRKWKLFFLSFVNYLLDGASIPDNWKVTHILPILKPGKDQAAASSYRPIALTPCSLKVTEHMVKNRLDWWLENHKKLSPNQMGFRKGVSTQVCLSKLMTDITLSLNRKQYMAAVFLDLSSAYDNVSIPVLAERLNSVGVSSKLSKLILQLISTKTMLIKNYDTLHGPRLTNQGVPQGSVLSPIIFNIYTADLERVVNQWVEHIQYADDIVLYSAHCNLEIAVNNINRALSALSVWLDDHNFTLSPSKSKSIIFSRKRNVVPPPITFNGNAITYEDSVKYLGVIFDKKLSWKQQTNNTVSKCQNGINIMKSLSKTTWGAESLTMLLIYKAIIRPHIDYSATLILPGNKTILTKLERIQFQALRIAIGAMRSSPTNALLIEAGEPPIMARTMYLASKQILKYSSTRNNVFHNIQRLSMSFRRQHNTKPKQILIEQYKYIAPLLYLLHSADLLPCYEHSFEAQITPCPVELNLGLHKRPQNNTIDTNLLFNAIIEEKYSGFIQVFTDASKNLTTLNTGCGIFIPQYNIESSIKIPEEFSIMYAEVIAIQEALNIIGNLPPQNFIILSDSLSSLQCLSKTSIQASADHIILNVKEKVFSLKSRGYNITIAWVPSHSGIKGNERADHLANESCLLEVYNTQYEVPSTCLLPECRRQSMNWWQLEWNVSSTRKGSFFHGHTPTVSCKPWFKNLHLSKKESSTISRLRLNHTLVPDHLFRFNIIQSNVCDCGEIADTHHVLFACNLYENDVKYLYSTLSKTFPTPISISNLLAKPSLDVCKLISQHISKNKILI